MRDKRAANAVIARLSGGGGVNNPLVATVSGLLCKFTHTRWGFAKIGTKLLRHWGSKEKCAFTLSEVLIVLAVLGGVAAMTIPDLIQDYQKKATATQVKKAYSTLNQVVTASAADNGPMSDFFAAHPTIDADTAKEYFDTYWLPYFRVQKVSNNNAKSFYDTFTPYYQRNGVRVSLYIYTNYSSKRMLFSDVAGTIYFIYVASYASGTEQIVYVDINGTNGPNTLGKDVFLFVVDINDGVVNPYLYKCNVNENCSISGNGAACAAKIKRDGWEIADDYPW